MQIHFLRNATLIIHTGAHRILVDPMLGPPGSLPPFAFVRHRPRRNPIVPLPPNVEPALEGVTVGLITHCRRGHFDHLDRTGWRHLTQHKTPVYCNELDVHYLWQRGLMTIPLKSDKRHAFLEGSILPVKTAHGYGSVGKLMGPGLGYWLELPQEPHLYLSGDTVLTSVVKRMLMELKPDVAVLAAGGASLDLGRPILMPIAEMLEFIRLAPGQVIATHMEALNHCPVTRDQFRAQITEAGLAHKVLVPEDGEMLTL